jgi:two-component system NtrC family response regulator
VLELPDEGLSLETVERDPLLAALEKHDWNQTKAAAYVDITRSALLYRMQKFGLERPHRDSRESRRQNGCP